MGPALLEVLKLVEVFRAEEFGDMFLLVYPSNSVNR